MPMLPLMRLPELKRMLDAEGETSTAQRLGYLVEQSGNIKLASVIHDWLPEQLPLIPLVSTADKPVHVPMIKHWRLLNNLGEPE